MTISQIIIIGLIAILGTLAAIVAVQIDRIEIYSDWMQEESDDEESE